jgi:hypothetical protein
MKHRRTFASVFFMVGILPGLFGPVPLARAQTHVWTGRGSAGPGNAEDFGNWGPHKPHTQGIEVSFTGRDVLLPAKPERPDNKTLDFQGAFQFVLNRPIVVEGGYTFRNFPPEGVVFQFPHAAEFRGRNTVDGNITWRQNNNWNFKAVPADAILTVTGDMWIQEQMRPIVFEHQGDLVIGGNLRSGEQIRLNSPGRVNVGGDVVLPGTASLVVDGGGLLRVAGNIDGAFSGHPAPNGRRVLHGTLILNGEVTAPHPHRGDAGYQIHGRPGEPALLGGAGTLHNDNATGVPFRVGFDGPGILQPGDLHAVEQPQSLTLVGGPLDLGPQAMLRLRILPEFRGIHSLALSGNAVMTLDPAAVLDLTGPPLTRGARFTIVSLQGTAKVEGHFQAILYNGRPLPASTRVISDRQGLHLDLRP